MCATDPPTRERGFSLTELLIVVLIMMTLAAIAIPNFMESRKTAYNASALSALRVIYSAEASYRASHPTYGDLNALGAAGVLGDPLLTTGHRSNYTYTMGTINADNFEVNANPDVSPWLYFYMDASGVIRVQNGSSASVTSPPLN
jgi:type IV pilus assembly protein PilA